MVIDSNGNVVVQYEYDAWGNHTVSGSNSALGNINPFRYRSYYFDTETKLYFLQTRYYDPEIGRFINIDGIENIDPENINGLNLYAYCNNNPVMNIDPEGTWSWKGFWRVVAAVAIVVVSVAAIAVTAGVAAGFVAGAVGLSATAVGATVAATSVAVGLSAGIGEIVNQCVDNGAEELNLGSVAVKTIGASIDGALNGASLFAGPMVTTALAAGRIGVSAATAGLYGLSEGQPKEEIISSVKLNCVGTALASGLMYFGGYHGVTDSILRVGMAGCVKIASVTAGIISKNFLMPLLGNYFKKLKKVG